MTKHLFVRGFSQKGKTHKKTLSEINWIFRAIFTCSKSSPELVFLCRCEGEDEGKLFGIRLQMFSFKRANKRQDRKENLNILHLF